MKLINRTLEDENNTLKLENRTLETLEDENNTLQLENRTLKDENKKLKIVNEEMNQYMEKQLLEKIENKWQFKQF